jgi:DNA-binding MarR family transcriptional regulator
MIMEHHFYQTCAYFTAARYMRTVEKFTDQIFAPTGMKPAYSYIMMAIEDENPLSIMQISERLGYDRSTISRMVKVLSKQNLVELNSKSRETIVELTADGREFLKISNQCLDKLGEATDELLGEDKPKMTKLLTSNNQKIRGALND